MPLNFFYFRYGDVSRFVNGLMILVSITFALPGRPASAKTVRILALGDSLSAVYPQRGVVNVA